MLGTSPNMTAGYLPSQTQNAGFSAGVFDFSLDKNQLSKNSFIRAKKPVDSGLFSLEEISSNSCSSSR